MWSRFAWRERQSMHLRCRHANSEDNATDMTSQPENREKARHRAPVATMRRVAYKTTASAHFCTLSLLSNHRQHPEECSLAPDDNDSLRPASALRQHRHETAGLSCLLCAPAVAAAAAAQSAQAPEQRTPAQTTIYDHLRPTDDKEAPKPTRRLSKPVIAPCLGFSSPTA